MSTEPLADPGAPHRAWPVVSNVYVAGRHPASWALPARPTTVFCLSRSLLEPELYDRAGLSPRRVLHRPFTYWESEAPVTLLDDLVREISRHASREQTLVHCTLGLDRTGVVALALLLKRVPTLGDALHRYRARGVRLPRRDALDVLTRYAEHKHRTEPEEAGRAH
ncbi:tyrosine-protein phosphatase [Streptomyces shenzhenensis]|uniref:tyrosine-protein phosphatase n=1 Tax=Streptomyces shenzhenensis TaxID=943815 RepID=UPI0036BB9C5F